MPNSSVVTSARVSTCPKCSGMLFIFLMSFSQMRSSYSLHQAKALSMTLYTRAIRVVWENACFVNNALAAWAEAL